MKSIETRIHEYNLWAQGHCLHDCRHFSQAQRRAAWLKRCADRQGVRLAVRSRLIYMHAGTEYVVPLYALKRNMVLLDER